MKPSCPSFTAAIACAAALTSSRAVAQAAGQPLTLAPGSSLRVDGDSTLHHWHTESTDIAIRFQEKAGAPAGFEAAARAGLVGRIVVTIPVASLRSGESGLDDNLRSALKAQAHPDIVFTIDRYQLGAAGANAFPVHLEGRLEVAGVGKPETVEAQATRTPLGLDVAGTMALRMTDFGVQPPVFMGLLHTSDPVRVTFHLQLPRESLSQGPR
jgi:polyisoprenoid-binding protein YceI